MALKSEALWPPQHDIALTVRHVSYVAFLYARRPLLIHSYQKFSNCCSVSFFQFNCTKSQLAHNVQRPFYKITMHAQNSPITIGAQCPASTQCTQSEPHVFTGQLHNNCPPEDISGSKDHFFMYKTSTNCTRGADYDHGKRGIRFTRII